MMKSCICIFQVLLLVLILLLPLMHARHISKLHSHHDHNRQPHPSRKDPSVEPELYRLKRRHIVRKGADPQLVAGSRLPDCTHACGSCTPCRLVMVSFVCSSIEEAETCPMAYKCMCNNKSYPVP